MEFLQAIKSRYSCRAYLNKPVDEAVIRSVVEAAQKSPSWGNTQPWRVWVAGGETAVSIRQENVRLAEDGAPTGPEIPMPAELQGLFKERYTQVGKSLFALMGIGREDEEKRKAHFLNNYNAFGAPVLVYLTVPESYTHYAVMDIGAFMNAFCLAATDQGLATCLQGALARYPDVVREHLPIPADEKIVVGIALGYPDTDARINTFQSSREPLEKVLSFTGF